MSILNQAINLYKNKNYRQALSLFEKVAEIYDVSWVEANIKLCQTALNLSEEVDKLNRKAVIDIDAATKIMCSNAKAISLNEVEKNEIISKYREITAKKSERAELKEVEPIPLDWPSDLTLPPLPESTNDYVWAGKKKELDDYPRKQLIIDGLSIVIPTYNRAKILAITLACLCNQKTIYDYEVIVADDGSKENIEEIVREFESLLNIKYVRQKDYGYQLCAVRNLGLRAAKYNYVAILDCDMAPNPLWVQSYMELLAVDDNVALIGPRKYIDTSKHTYLDFLSQKSLINEIPEIITNNQVAGKVEQNKSVDWRIEHFKNTDNLRLCNTPFRFFSGGNVAFAKNGFSVQDGLMKSLRIGGRIMSLDIVSTEKDVTFGLLKEQWHIIKNHQERKRDGSCGREKYYCSIVTAKSSLFL